MRNILLSVNENVIDKNIGGSTKQLRDGWEPRELTCKQLAELVDRGCAFSVQYTGSVRKGTNFNCAGFLAIDSDGGFSVADALADPYIHRFGSIFYTTASHGQDGKDKFRVVFATETPIESAERFALAMLGLAEKLNTDRSIADAARILFGSKGSNPKLLGGFLPDREVKALVKAGRAARKARQQQNFFSDAAPERERLPFSSESGTNGVPISLLIRLSGGGTAAFGDIPKGAGIFCPFHSDERPSAFTLLSRQGAPGIHCKACGKTWFQEGSTPPPKYNFYKFDDTVEKAAKDLGRLNAQMEEKGQPPSNKTAEIINQKYLPPLILQEGITLVKSPKGSGKTHALKTLVKLAKRKKLSVLLIVHRQTLARELSDKLELRCYLDHPHKVMGPDGKMRANPPPDYFACSVDSLPIKLSSTRPYDIVLIDESEQVFSHVTARTMRNAHQVMLRLHNYVRVSPAIYLFDADLNQITFNFVMSARKENPKQPLRMILNRYIAENRVCEMYKSPTQLVADMMESARAGKRIFVASNSKTRAQTLANMLRKEVGDNLRVLLITAEEKVTDEVQDFLSDIPNKYLKYDVVIASPAIGTGIDITFPDDAQVIDIVYGFFIAGINSHYDVDQQLGRVRNPKQVKVWVSGKRSRFETDLEAIKYDIVRTEDAHHAITDFRNGLPVFDIKHPLLTLQATAYCAQRASQNALKELFVFHKQRNGVKIIAGSNNSKEAKAVTKKMQAIKAENESARQTGILSAAPIDQYAWKDYYDRKATGESIGPAAAHQMARFEIQNFYNLPVTTDLIELDANGKFRVAVILFQKLGLSHPYSAGRLLKRWNSKKFTLGERIGEIPLRCIAGVIVSAGLINENGFDTDNVVTKPDLAAFLGFCDEHRVTVERDLGIVLRQDRRHNPVRALNQILELIGLEVIPLGTTQKKGAAVYRYGLDKDKLKWLLKIVAARQKPRCDLPEMLDPPRPRQKSGLDAALQTDTIFDVFDLHAA